MNMNEIVPPLVPETVAISVFDDVYAKQLHAENASWNAICEKLDNPPEFPSKAHLPMLKLATFGDMRSNKGSLRWDANVRSVSGIEADYDGKEVSMQEAAAKLQEAGIESYLYTSPSHTPTAPRWRVICPLSRPYLPHEREQFVRRLDAVLGNILAEESFRLSQAYYFCRVKGVHYETLRIHGQPIDLLATTSANNVSEPLVGDSGQTLLIDGVEVPEYLRDLGTDEVVKNLAAGRAFPQTYPSTPENIEIVRDMLSRVPPDNGIPDSGNRSPWLHILFSVASLGWGEIGENLCRNWSKPGLYDEQAFNTTWRSYDPKRKSFTIGTLIKFAQDAGYAGPMILADLPQSASMDHPTANDAEFGSQYDSLIDRTDTGNANLLIQITDGNLRFVPERHLWLWWNGERWIEDAYGSTAQAAALRVARHYHEKAEEIAKAAVDSTLNDQERKRILASVESMNKWAAQCRNKRALDSMLALASKNSAVQLNAAELNKNPYLFGVANGVIDLRTGELRSAAREDFVTKRSAVKFVPDATAPRWKQFIEEITGEPLPTASTVGDFNRRPQLAEYLQRALGYSITGLTSAQKMFICIGSGSNGKNVLLDIFQWITGDYCQTIPPEVLMATRHDADAERPSPTAASLAGARAAISSESKDGQKLDVAMVKRHTGGGYMTARMMRENPFRFDITHKLWLMTNAKPALDHLDDAIRGRLHLIPFDRKWNRPDDAMRNPALPDGDGNLKTSLEAEAEGILAWLAQGAATYLKDGLQPPPEVLRVTNEYFHTQDALGLWLEGYETCLPKDGTPAGQLLSEFVHWCHEEGFPINAFNGKTFGPALSSRGIEGKKISNGKYYGLRKKDSAANTDSVVGWDTDDG